jgi:3-phosphoshikimate 1-carboxyvinyltransferase
MERIAIVPGRVDAELSVPGSKSLTNRALVAGALARGETSLDNASISDDSRHLAAALRALGFDATESRVVGRGGAIPAESASLSVGNAGTAMRFLVSFLCLGRGRYVIDGDARMRERPIGPLCDALRALGASLRDARGYPPVEIEASGLEGGATRVVGDASSQFLSSLLLAAPVARDAVEIEAVGGVVSRPYVEMTIGMMRAFGVEVGSAGDRFHLKPQRYRAGRIAIEPDAAAAGYHWARAAVTGGRARIRGLGKGCRQPEAGLVDDLERMGCAVERGESFIEVRGPAGPLAAVDVDMNSRPDSVQTLACVALFAKGRTRIRNVANLRIKETDRLAALAHELGRLGARVIEHADGLEIDPPAAVRGGEVGTYGDHRMAMSFAVVGAAAPGIVIQDPGVVAKSYPGFWGDINAL